MIILGYIQIILFFVVFEGSESDDSEDEAEPVEKPKASSMLKQVNIA